MIGKEAVHSLTAKVKDKLCTQWKYATFQQIHDKKLDRYIAKYGGCNVDRKREVGESKKEHENAVKKEWAVFNSAIQECDTDYHQEGDPTTAEQHTPVHTRVFHEAYRSTSG